MSLIQHLPEKLPPEIIEAVLASTEIASYSRLRELGKVTVVTVGSENAYLMKDDKCYFTKLLNPDEYLPGYEMHLATWEHPEEAKGRDPRLVYMQRVRRNLKSYDYAASNTADNALYFESGDCRVTVKSVDSGEPNQHFLLTVLASGVLRYNAVIPADDTIDPETLCFLIHEEAIDALREIPTSGLNSGTLLWWM